MNNIFKKILAAFLILFNMHYVCAIEYVEDELVSGLNPSVPVINNVLYEDDLVKGLKAKAIIVNLNGVDDFMLDYIDKDKIEKPKVNLTFDYADFRKEKLKIRPLNYITTRNKSLKEGDKISFKVLEDINFKNQVIKKGDIINARIETISQNGAYGVPSNLKIGDFRYKDLYLDGSINITGANRTLWLYPTSYVLDIFFGAGLLLIPIRGGHGKLKPTKQYVVEIN